jgi:hypothetical protein
MAEQADSQPILDREIERVALARLDLDPRNPRFGFQGDSQATQTEILDHIVDTFGVDDVLSSLAVNGYFEAEPIVCRKSSRTDKLLVLEGNRRVAACLTITGAPSAVNQAKRTSRFGSLWENNGKPRIDPVAAIVFEENEDKNAVLSYLGVRHIASSQPWDSYAKAAWVAEVVASSGVTVRKIATMIGDQHRTINRLLEGYYLVQQLVDSAQFDPSHSVRRGRGSVTEYPFSWVYTVLGYTTVRNFLGLAEGGAEADPVPHDKLENGGLLLRSMFGDTDKGRNPAVQDSRELRLLATAFSDSRQIRLLRQGKSVAEIHLLSQTLERRLTDGLGEVNDTLLELIGRMSEQDIERDLAADLLKLSGGNRKLATEIDVKLRAAALGADDDGQ